MEAKPVKERAPEWAEALGNLPPGYTLDDTGVAINGEWLCGPLWVVAETRDDQEDNAWGVATKWINKAGNIHELAFCSKDFHVDGGRSVYQQLIDYGLSVKPGKTADVIKYLAQFNPGRLFHCARSIGWNVRDGRQLAFVMPSRVITAAETDRSTRTAESLAISTAGNIIYQPERYSPTTKTMKERGTIEEWKENIVKKIADEPYLVFALSVAFAAPLSRFSGQGSAGFNLHQTTSKGKTTAVQVAATVYGNGIDPQWDGNASFVRTWNTTGNALEALAAAHNDCLFVMDEIGKCNEKLGSLLYNLFGGQGKSRMDSNGNLRNRRDWNLLLLSTGEETVEAMIERDGKARGGQLIRFADIPIEDSVFLNQENPGEYAKELKELCGQFYGSAGPVFIQELTDIYLSAAVLSDDLKGRIKSAHDELKEEADAMTPEVSRLSERFGLLLAAGQMARDLLELPLTEDQVRCSIKHVYDKWRAGAGSKVSDGKRIIQNIREYIIQNPARFPDSSTDGDDLPRVELSGYRTTDGDGGRIYLFTKPGLKTASGNGSAEISAKELDKAGLLYRNNGRALKSRFQIKSLDSRSYFYAVRGDILGGDEIEAAS